VNRKLTEDPEGSSSAQVSAQKTGANLGHQANDQRPATGLVAGGFDGGKFFLGGAGVDLRAGDEDD
jgi:hypothetical protein